MDNGHDQDMRDFKKNGEQSYTHRDGQTDKTFTYKTGEEGRPLTQREPSWCDKYPRHPRCQEVKKPFTRDRDPVEVDFSSDNYCQQNPNDEQCQRYNSPFQAGLGVAGVPTDLTAYGKNREIWNNPQTVATIESKTPNIYNGQPQYRTPEMYTNPPLVEQQGTANFGSANTSTNCNVPPPPTYTTAEGGTLNQVIKTKKNNNMFQGKTLYGAELDIYKRSFYNPLDFV